MTPRVTVSHPELVVPCRLFRERGESRRVRYGPGPRPRRSPSRSADAPRASAREHAASRARPLPQSPSPWHPGEATSAVAALRVLWWVAAVLLVAWIRRLRDARARRWQAPVVHQERMPCRRGCRAPRPPRVPAGTGAGDQATAAARVSGSWIHGTGVSIKSASRGGRSNMDCGLAHSHVQPPGRATPAWLRRSRCHSCSSGSGRATIFQGKGPHRPVSRSGGTAHGPGSRHPRVAHP